MAQGLAPLTLMLLKGQLYFPASFKKNPEFWLGYRYCDGYFYIPRNILELYSGMWLSYLETVWSFWVLLEILLWSCLTRITAVTAGAGTFNVIYPKWIMRFWLKMALFLALCEVLVPQIFWSGSFPDLGKDQLCWILQRDLLKTLQISLLVYISLWYSVLILAASISLNAQIQIHSSGHLLDSACVPLPQPPPMLFWKLKAVGWGNCRAHLFYFSPPGINVLCCLISSILKTIISYTLPFWGVVSGRRVNLVPFTPSWSEAEFWGVLKNMDNLTLFNNRGNGEDEYARDGGEEAIVVMRWEGTI